MVLRRLQKFSHQVSTSIRLIFWRQHSKYDWAPVVSLTCTAKFYAATFIPKLSAEKKKTFKNFAFHRIRYNFLKTN
jgi:hypothetical protein